MKLLFLFAFLALVCVARSAPVASPATPRQLILPDYHNDEDANEGSKPHNDEIEINPDEDDDDDDETTTTTTTTTRRSVFVFPTRNRKLFPSRQPTEGTTTTRRVITTTAFDVEEEQEEEDNKYDGDFRYIRNFRKYLNRVWEDFQKMFRKLTGFDMFGPKKPQTVDLHDE